jgi:hypothetical protein
MAFQMKGRTTNKTQRPNGLIVAPLLVFQEEKS